MTDYTWVFVLQGTGMAVAGVFSIIVIYRLLRYGPESIGAEDEPPSARG